jgi:hypothetical protein
MDRTRKDTSSSSKAPSGLSRPFNPTRQSITRSTEFFTRNVEGPRSIRPSGSSPRDFDGLPALSSGVRSFTERGASHQRRTGSPDLPSSSNRNVSSGHYETDGQNLSVRSPLGLRLNYDSIVYYHQDREGPQSSARETAGQETLSTRSSGSSFSNSLGNWQPSSMRLAGMSSTPAWDTSPNLASSSLHEITRPTQERDLGPLGEIFRTSRTSSRGQDLFESPPNLASSSDPSLGQPSWPTPETQIDPRASSSLLGDVVPDRRGLSQATVSTQEVSHRAKSRALSTLRVSSDSTVRIGGCIFSDRGSFS